MKPVRRDQDVGKAGSTSGWHAGTLANMQSNTEDRGSCHLSCWAMGKAFTSRNGSQTAER
jgi:hypothetical protein